MWTNNNVRTQRKAAFSAIRNILLRVFRSAYPLSFGARAPKSSHILHPLGTIFEPATSRPIPPPLPSFGPCSFLPSSRCRPGSPSSHLQPSWLSLYVLIVLMLFNTLRYPTFLTILSTLTLLSAYKQLQLLTAEIQVLTAQIQMLKFKCSNADDKCLKTWPTYYLKASLKRATLAC